jgi:sortase A
MLSDKSDKWGPLPPHASPPPRRALRWLERLLLVVGLLSLGYYGYVSAEAALYQAYETRQLEAILASVSTRGRDAPAPAAVPRVQPAPGSIVGRIEIKRLGLSAIVRAGSDARTLRLAVGHIPGTSLPGESGNVGLAAHRDTFFRRLGEVRHDDEIRLVLPGETFSYRVDGTRIVEPADIWVLDPTDRPALTLVTCYPFSFVGSAPQRFIVRAYRAPVPAAVNRAPAAGEARPQPRTAMRHTHKGSASPDLD